jgi:hypothetical protein
LGFSPKNGGI